MVSSSSRLVLMGRSSWKWRIPRERAEMFKDLVKFATILLAKAGHMAKPRVSVVCIRGQYQKLYRKKEAYKGRTAVQSIYHSHSNPSLLWRELSNIHLLCIQQFHSASYLRKILGPIDLVGFIRKQY